MVAQNPYRVSIRTAGIDWITATSHSDVGRDEYRKLGARIAASEDRQGNKPAVWGWQGYSGWHAGGLTYGERKDGAILRLSGALAAGYWRDAVRWSSNISRLDLEVTVHLSPFPRHLGTVGYRSVLAAVPEGAEPPNASLHVSTDGGETLYLGRRASDKYSRLYNKAVESKEPAFRGCWRYELELKGLPAKTTADRLMASTDAAP